MMENFFVISLFKLNLFSFVLGMMYGLSSYRWNQSKSWLQVVAYFACVGAYYAIQLHSTK